MNAIKQPLPPKQYSEAAMAMVESIYDYAAGKVNLETALAAYADIMGEVDCGIFSHDPILDIVEPKATVGETKALVERYRETHGRWSPLFELGLERMKQGEIVTSDELMPFSELINTDYYREVLAPLQMRYCMACMIIGKGQTWSSLASARREDSGEYTQTHYQHADLFRKHMARAMRILELGGTSKLTPELFESSLENLPIGLLLLNDELDILACNDRARSHLDGKTRIKNRDGKLRVGTTPNRREAFHAWWRILVSDVASDGAAFRSAELHPVWELEASRINLNALPEDNERHWLVTIKENPGIDQLLSKPHLKQRFHLSEAEALVCVNLCRSGDAVSTAQVMGLSPHTVRTHLKNIFKKTGTRNQVQLALKLTSYLH